MINVSDRRLTCLRQEKAFTLIEIMLVVAVAAAIFFAIIQLVSPMTKFFQRSQTRQQATMELRRCLDTIERVLSNGKASTMVISSPVGNPTPPQNSQAHFKSVDGSFYTITWSSAPINTVHLLSRPPGGALNDTVLATHVTDLHFDFDLQDPSLVQVSLRMRIPLDSSGSPDSFQDVSMPAQTVRMISAQ